MPGMDGFINFNGTLEGSIAGGDSGAVKDVKTNASGSYQSVVDDAGNAMIDLSVYAKETDVSEDIQLLSDQLDNKQDIINYSTNEQVIGTWMGETLYEKIFTLPSMQIFSPTTKDITNLADFSMIKQPVMVFGIYDVEPEQQCLPLLFFKYNGIKVQASNQVAVTKLLIQYTKTTDTAQ